MTRKSIWPLAAGVLFVVVITTLVDIVLHLTRVFPPMDQPIDDVQALLATSYRIVIGVGGAWLTAKMAPSKPMTHVMWLGAIGTLLAAAAVVGTWNLGLGPRWYPVAIAVLAIPQSWAGGKLALRQSGSS
jgi:hypothetical protein